MVLHYLDEQAIAEQPPDPPPPAGRRGRIGPVGEPGERDKGQDVIDLVLAGERGFRQGIEGQRGDGQRAQVQSGAKASGRIQGQAHQGCEPAGRGPRSHRKSSKIFQQEWRPPGRPADLWVPGIRHPQLPPRPGLGHRGRRLSTSDRETPPGQLDPAPLPADNARGTPDPDGLSAKNRLRCGSQLDCRRSCSCPRKRLLSPCWP